MVYHVCSRYTRDAEIKQELSQDIFCKVFQNYERFDQQYEYGTWIHRIAVNRCIDFYRKNRGITEEPIEYLEERFVADSQVPHSDPVSAVQLEKIFKSLDDEMREIVILSFLEGYSHQEIADTLGKDRSTISKKIRIWQKKLKNDEDSLSKGGVFLSIGLFLGSFFSLFMMIVRLISIGDDING